MVLGPKPRVTEVDEGRVGNDSWWIDVPGLFLNRANAKALTDNPSRAGIHQALCICETFKVQYPYFQDAVFLTKAAYCTVTSILELTSKRYCIERVKD